MSDEIETKIEAFKQRLNKLEKSSEEKEIWKKVVTKLKLLPDEQVLEKIGAERKGNWVKAEYILFFYLKKIILILSLKTVALSIVGYVDTNILLEMLAVFFS